MAQAIVQASARSTARPGARHVPVGALREWLHSHDISTEQVSAIEHGTQAIVYRVERVGDADPLILKVLRSERDANQPSVVRREYDALAEFHEATASIPDITSPRPIAKFEEGMAYLMSFVPGRSIEATVRHEARQRSDELARSILRGLDVYHDAVGEVYGDFNALNVLVTDDDRLAFLDPTPTNTLQELLADGPHSSKLTADLGYWTFSTTVRSARQLLAGSPVPFRLRGLTSAMLSRAAHGVQNVDQFVRTVYQAAGAHNARMAERSARKDKLLASTTALSLRALERRTLSRL